MHDLTGTNTERCESHGFFTGHDRDEDETFRLLQVFAECSTSSKIALSGAAHFRL